MKTQEISTSLDLVANDTLAPVERLHAVSAAPVSKARRLLERGMTTAEYAVGILAAVALALVLFKIITGSAFGNGMLIFVLSLLTKVSALLPR